MNLFDKIGIRIEAFFGCPICKYAISVGLLNNKIIPCSKSDP